ncbi:hypothetical protein BJV82DRAFT_574609 [Fennellomyces sp. T-0311]|nr:hypothetical protein BJV82DRAFT_574609 [Fennellomyces sp. T-0311]
MRCLLPAVSLFAIALALQESSNDPASGQVARVQDSAVPQANGVAAPLANGAATTSGDATHGDIQLLPPSIANLLPFTGNLNPLHVYGPAAQEQQERSGTNDPPLQQQVNQAPAEPAIQPAEPNQASNPLQSQQQTTEQQAQPPVQVVADKPAQQVQQPQVQEQQPQSNQQLQVPQQVQPPQAAQIPPGQQAQPPVRQQDSPVAGQVAAQDPPAAQPPIDLNNNQVPTSTMPLPTFEPTITMPSPTVAPTTAPSPTAHVSTLTRTVTATPMPTHNAAPAFSCPKALIAMTIVSLVAGVAL